MVNGNARKVYCEFDNTNKVAWTLVSRIASGETYHMCSNAYGSLTSSTQSAAWKLSDADINTLKGKSSLNNPYKFYCSQTRTSGKNTQYFEKACKFDGSAPLEGSSGSTTSKDSPCHNYHDSYSDTTNNVGYADYNDCGLGGHASIGTHFSYGWHSCRGQTNGKPSGADYCTWDNPNGATSLGCGHNSAGSVSGHGRLWIGHQQGDA